MKRKHLYHLLICLTLFLSQSGLGVRATLRLPVWQLPVTNYTRHDYHGGTQNWMLDQHPNGWVYIANNAGMLEFDGTTWSTYPIHNAKTRAVKVGEDGRIYIGGMGQFGYFVPNRLGQLEYVCLSDSLPEGAQAGIIWNIWPVGERVWFQSDSSLLCWHDGKLTSVDYHDDIRTTLLWERRLYVATTEALFVQEADGTEPRLLFDFHQSGLDSRICKLLSLGEELLIVTSEQGLFRYDGAALKPFHTSADEFCRQNKLFCAAMQDSLLALGSIQEGICLLNLKSDKTELFSLGNGLQNKTILGMMFDNRGNLWLGLDNGVDCIDLNAVTIGLFGNKPLIGSGYASCAYHGRLYLGTNQGLYYSDSPDAPERETEINFVPGTSGQVWSLSCHDGKLFCCSDNGLFLMEGQEFRKLPGLKGVWNVVSLKGEEDLLLAGTYGGLYRLRKLGGKWMPEGRVEGFYYSCKNLLPGDEPGTVWVSNKTEGMYLLRLSDDRTEVAEQKNYNTPAFPAGRGACLVRIDGELLAASQEGIWHYNHRLDTLEESQRWEQRLGGKVGYKYLAIDSLQNLWYAADGCLRMLHYDPAARGHYRRHEGDLLRGALIAGYENVTLCGRKWAVAGTEEGFTLIKLDCRPVRTVPPSLSIRKVYLTGQSDSLVYGRSYTHDPAPVVIPYNQNSLRIEYSACGNSRFRTCYAYKLSRNGEEARWSSYSENNQKEFTGLREGDYEFSVRLLAQPEEEPVVTTFHFHVLPPWYRTWWSYLLYLLLAGGLGWYIYYRIADSQKRMQLEQQLELYRQQQEFQKSNEQKDKEINLLKEEKLQAELEHKSEELINTTLNIVRKNELLQNIRKEAVSLFHAIGEDSVELRRKAGKLLSRIDNNMEHEGDLQSFYVTFDAVHRNFLKRLSDAYPELTQKEMMLCAYILMDLSSKEIAPLLNISLRGVEIARFRLRRKLNLDVNNSINLTDFLKRFRSGGGGEVE